MSLRPPSPLNTTHHAVLGSDARLDRERVRELDRSMVLVEVAVEESETL